MRLYYSRLAGILLVQGVRPPPRATLRAHREHPRRGGVLWPRSRCNVVAHEERLQAILLQFLVADDRVTIIGKGSAAQELGVKSQRLVEAVEAVEARSRYEFRSGHIYSHRLLRDVCGPEDVDDGVVKVSLLHDNTRE